MNERRSVRVGRASEATDRTDASERTDRVKSAITAAGSRTPTEQNRIGVFDGALYALFSRHADRQGHERNRRRYRATDLRTSFGVYLSRVYALSWVSFLVGGGLATGIVLSLSPAVVVVVSEHFPGATHARLAAGAGVIGGLLAKRCTVAGGGTYLRWTAAARRTGIERTLPGAVRYLRALAAGTGNGRTLLRQIADNPRAYGDTAVEFRKALNNAAMTGNLGQGLRMVSRDTPSQDALTPFLLKFHEHARQGPDALANYLEMESRMLSHRQARTRQRAEGFLELLAEVFIVILVVPALLVIVLTVVGVLSPGLGTPMSTPFGAVTPRAIVVYGSAAFVLVAGVAAASIVAKLRPVHGAVSTYERPAGIVATVRSSPSNPESAVVVAAPLAILTGVGLSWLGTDPITVVLLAYVSFALPVGGVALRRAKLDDAKDREIKDFVHAVSGHVALGRPFETAVEEVARDSHLGPLEPHVHDLAFHLSLTNRAPDGQEIDLRTAALRRFVEDVGTPLSRGTIGLVTGALELGSDAETVFETLQTEIGHLYHERKALRSTMVVYVAVGWTTALLVVGITVAVQTHVLDGFAQLSALSEGTVGTALDPTAVDPERDRYRFYVIAQSTMLSCGWFAGMASRGPYEALLHSGALVLVAHVVFVGVGMA